MPAAAARLADLGAGHQHPLEPLRRLLHFPQQLAVGGLDRRAGAERGAGLADPLGEAVADRLQLAEAEQPRLGGEALDPVGDLGVAESLAEERGELRLEARDLAAQLQPRLALADSCSKPGELIAIQQSGHRHKV